MALADTNTEGETMRGVEIDSVRRRVRRLYSAGQLRDERFHKAIAALTQADTADLEDKPQARDEAINLALGICELAEEN
jgi:hypothetical protein